MNKSKKEVVIGHATKDIKDGEKWGIMELGP